MPIRPPALDDRSFDDLVADLVRRIPAHAPEWTNPRAGDPGMTLIDLFAWLGDTILYRANVLPERQRLAFLRLLGVGMLPAQPAQGLVQVAIDDPAVVAPVTLPMHAAIDRPQHFETLTEVTVHAVSAQAYIKRRPNADEAAQFRDLLPDLQELYGLTELPQGYVTTPLFSAGAEADGRDVAQESVDGYLWLALLAGQPAQIDAVRAELGGGAENRRLVLNVGFAPAMPMLAPFDDIGVRARVAYVWEVNTGAGAGDAYLPLELQQDGTAGLTRAGIARVLLPGKDDMGAPINDVAKEYSAGVGEKPPRIDDPAVAARIVTWIRLRPLTPLTSLRVCWAGVNAVAIEQRRTLGRQTIGFGTGASGLQLPLGADSVEAATLQIEVEEEEGLRPWRQVPDTAAAGRDDRVYSLDAEAGIVSFGDGVRGMVPTSGRAVQVALMRAGGGAIGNLTAGSIRSIAGPAAPRLKVTQPLPTLGGADAEDLATAEARIPAILRHANRAVTAADYRELALRVPGVAVGRAEVLERFLPAQRRSDVSGVVSVMVIPARDGFAAPCPRPDRPTLESVHTWLDERRPLATELYVIGVDYVPVGVLAGVELVDTSQREAVLAAVADAIRQHLWPLMPGGPDGNGWPLGRSVEDRMIEVAIGRVPGVRSVAPVQLYARRAGDTTWRRVPEDATGRVRLPLLPWQLPELAMLAVSEGDPPNVLPPESDAAGAVPVPVVPEVC
ncbi:putative baseplate assembly protein [Paraburkholderia atlantica]|uniref:putative baseplate assembly protein n=1 Tax=Paraburkholderia atlantica TaxID=2654982 RepID=UPI003D203446